MAISLSNDLLRQAADLSQDRAQKYTDLVSELNNLHLNESVKDLLSAMPDGKIKVFLYIDGMQGMVCIGKHPFKTDSGDDARTRFFVLKETGEYEQTSPGTEKVRQWTDCSCAEMLEFLGVNKGSLARIRWVEETVKVEIEKIAKDIVDTISRPVN